MIRASFLLLLACVLAGCKSVPPPTPLSELNAQQLRGHDVFRARCGVCHYDRQSGGLQGPSLVGIFKKQYLPSGAPANDERVTAAILHGRGLMPAMGNTLDAQDLDDLVAYLHTL
jgi:mono/diheme cytochrome c family protein